MDVIKSKSVTALFVRKNSIYKELVLDCYDIERDARSFKGETPVITHPPCRAWGQLSHFAKPRPGEKELAFFAIQKVRSNGGVLEHPRASKLFPGYLPYPGSYDSYGGFTISIDQFWFGHKAKKSTFLYICGCRKKDLPRIPLRFDCIEHVVGRNSRTKSKWKKEITKSEREQTPPALAKWLIQVAENCALNK